MACGCGKKRGGCRGPNCGSRRVIRSIEPETGFLLVEQEEPVDNDVVFAAAQESLVVTIGDQQSTWKSGQSRMISKAYYEQLISEGAPIWKIS